MLTQNDNPLIDIDFSAAFDAVDHRGLVEVLDKQYDVCGTALN